MSKFLSYEDRLIIAQRLQENASFGEIGKELGYASSMPLTESLEQKHLISFFR